MDRKQHEAIEKIMKNKELSDVMEKVSPGIKGIMAGYLLSHWFPLDLKRRLIMLFIFLVSIIGSLTNIWFLLLLIILPLFSSRIVGELLILIGKHKNKLRKK